MLYAKRKAGFTLIELLVVVIIVAVLAAVGIPLLSGNVEAARMTEASAGLGAIRTAMRSELAEQTVYDTTITPGMTAVAAGIGIKAGDLTGRFFEDDDYVIASVGATTFCARVTGDTGGPAGATAPRGQSVNGLSRSMNQDGTIYSTADCTGTALN